MKQAKSTGRGTSTRRATTPEAREDQLIQRAVDLAEQQLIDGTASAQVITHYLRLASTKERLKKEIMLEEKKLLEAKTEAIKSQQVVQELYTEALAAMRTYSGNASAEESDEDDDY